MPPGMLYYLKKLYYPHLLKSISENKFPYFPVVKRLVEPGNTVVDVGSNIGLVTVLLSRLVGDQGLVHSLEPIPVTFNLLAYNVKKLGLKNVYLSNFGLSNRDGFAEMEVPLYSAGYENFYQAHLVKGKGDTSLRIFAVKVRKLDSILSGLSSPISFVKVDVEGHMLEVIQGATQVIKNFHPSFLIEVRGDPDDKKSRAYTLFELLLNEGYEPYYFNGNELVKRSSIYHCEDYFFLSPAHIEKYKKRKI